MATTFLEPGGDADFETNDFWRFSSATLETDFVNSTHVKSIGYPANGGNYVFSQQALLADAGSRISFWLYVVTLPTATCNFIYIQQSNESTVIFRLAITSAGALQLYETTNQLGSNGPTLATGTWMRISIAYTITSTTVNSFKIFVNGTSAISVTNGSLTNTGTDNFGIGNISSDATFNARSSDHYVDNSSSLSDPGNIYITAKRPFANGTTNGFSTSGTASGYGSGHAEYVNYRPIQTATANVNIVGAGSAVTEEYNIEGESVGDINISGATIIDFLGWLYAKSLASETGQIIVNGNNSNISLTSTTTLFQKIAGSTSYPAGTGSDIGIISSSTVTTVTLYDAGIIVAFIPAVVVASNPGFKSLLGVGR